MFASINQIQSPNNEDDDQTERRHDWENKYSYSAIKEPVQESFLGYYSHDFGQAEDFACCGGVVTASNPLRISYERLMKEGFDLASPKMKAKKRKAEVVDGGGRVIRATGRKDRHSKVCTARGPRDRRLRLSPRTAIQFYDVQDRLGYDRPSKAIDWLINEAKTAIDALASDSNAAENYSLSIPNHGGFSLSQRGVKEKQKHDFNDDSLVSGFSCFGDPPPPYVADLEAYLDKDFSSLLLPNYQQGSCSALIPETNWEMARLQKMVTWNHGKENSDRTRGGGEEAEQYSSGNSVALHAAAQPIPGHINLFTQREPLQSSVINYSLMNNDFAGFNFSNELSKITVSAAMKQDENLKKKKKKLVFSMPSTTPHSQD